MRVKFLTFLILIFIAGCGGDSDISSAPILTSSPNSSPATVAASGLTFPLANLFETYIGANKVLSGAITGVRNNKSVTGNLTNNTLYTSNETANLINSNNFIASTCCFTTYTNLNRLKTTEAISITTDGTTIGTNLISDFYLTSTNTPFIQNDTTNKIQTVIADFNIFPSSVKISDTGHFYTASVYDYSALDGVILLCGNQAVNYTIEADTLTSVLLKIRYNQTKTNSACTNSLTNTLVRIDTYRLSQSTLRLISFSVTTNSSAITISY